MFVNKLSVANKYKREGHSSLALKEKNKNKKISQAGEMTQAVKHWPHKHGNGLQSLAPS